MKSVIKKLITMTVVLFIGALPSMAKVNGGISSQYFYDLEKTIMPELLPDTTMKTEKYWERNVLHINKYRPIFMLSNKELFDLTPEKKAPTRLTRFSAPSVYNISFKTSSIKKISLSQPKIAPIKKKNETPKVDLQSITLYENAKNKDVDCDQKIDTAILLKETRNNSNYALAVDLLNDVTKKEPYNAYAYYVKGDLYALQSDTENAMKSYLEALKLNPFSKQSCLGIAKILEPTNKKLAQKYYEKAK